MTEAFNPTVTITDPDGPMIGAGTLDGARDQARRWAQWATSPAAYTTELAEQLVAYLAFAATLAELPAPVIGAWVEDLDEPIEILTAFGHLTAAAWLAVIDDLPADHTRTAVFDRAQALARYAPVDPATTIAGPVGEPWVYDSLIGWMNGFFFPVFQRVASGSKQPWCPQWWRHPEAVQRLNALWRAFETMRAGPEPEWSTWWTGHLDPHLAALCDRELGPFSQCADGHRDYETDFPHDPPAERWPLPTLEANQP